jgi:hypothetical protein
MRGVELELGSLGRFCAGDAPPRSATRIWGERVSVDLLMSGYD